MNEMWRLRVCAALTAGLFVAGVTAALVSPVSERGPSGPTVLAGAPLIGSGDSLLLAARPAGDGIADTRVVIDGVRASAAQLAADRAAAAAELAARQAAQREASRKAAAARPVVAAAPRPAPVARPRPVLASRPGPTTSRLIWPADGELTGWYGEARGDHTHNGIDIDGDTGDPIWAGADGTVVMAGNGTGSYNGYGLMVIIDHGDFTTLSAHLSRIDVSVGQAVKGGDVIGLMGATGQAQGSHLHFEVRIDGRPVDPMPYLPPR